MWFRCVTKVRFSSEVQEMRQLLLDNTMSFTTVNLIMWIQPEAVFIPQYQHLINSSGEEARPSGQLHLSALGSDHFFFTVVNLCSIGKCLLESGEELHSQCFECSEVLK